MHMSGIRPSALKKLDDIKQRVKPPLEKIKGLVEKEHAWNASLFNPQQNTLFLDVDDTILSAGANFIAGIDNTDNQISRSIPEEETTPSKNVYPKALEFINLVSAGASDDELQPTTGNLFVTTARPQNMGKKVKAEFEDYFQRHEPDRLYRNPVGYLWGSKIKGTLFAMKCTEQLARDKVTEKARLARDKVNEKLHRVRESTNQDPAKRKSLKYEFSKLGNSKFDRIKKQILAIQELHPQYRRSSKLFFLGDDGQGDLYASIKLLQEDLVDFVFIHDVRNLKAVPEADWADRDPEAAGVELYGSISSELRHRIFLFRNYDEAIKIASSFV